MCFTARERGRRLLQLGRMEKLPLTVSVWGTQNHPFQISGGSFPNCVRNRVMFPSCLKKNFFENEPRILQFCGKVRKKFQRS